MSIVVICPTRGRPKQALETYLSFEETKAEEDTRLVFVIDNDDETWLDYDPRLSVLLLPNYGRGMGYALNEATMFLIEGLRPTYVGMVGDDNRFRSKGWDTELAKVLNGMGGGVAYGDDLWHHDALPTAWFVSASIVKALGWFAMPTLTHLYMDNVWETIGKGINRYAYVPSAVIEHLHPTYGKGEWDDSYRKTNSPEMYEHDRNAFEEWLKGQVFEDIYNARQALA